MTTAVHARTRFQPAARSQSIAGRVVVLLVVFWEWLVGPAARAVGRGLVRARSFVFQAGGLGLICWSLYMWHAAAGAAGAGVSLLVLEFLMRSDAGGGR